MAWGLGSGLGGRGVVVTGAVGGVGWPTGQVFASAGARVVAVDLRQCAADEVVAGLGGGGHVAVGLDLTGFDAQKALVVRAVDGLGDLFVLAHLAAVLRRRGSMVEVTEEDWDFPIDTNLKASFFVARGAAETMVDAGRGGRIIMFTSQRSWSVGGSGQPSAGADGSSCSRRRAGGAAAAAARRCTAPPRAASSRCREAWPAPTARS